MTDKDVANLGKAVEDVKIGQSGPDDDELEAEAQLRLKAKEKKLDQGGHLVVEQSNDLGSPIASASTFEELGLQKALLDGVFAHGFSKPSRIQAQALPIILQKPVNLIAQAQSGTGKTATFALCMLQKVNTSLKYPQCICLAPTRELARQIDEEIRILGKMTNVSVQLVVKDKDIPKKVESQIVVGTPGRMSDAVQRGWLNLSKVIVFVLDEADMMITANLGEQSIKLRQKCASSQILLFSATYSKQVLELAARIVPKPFVRLTLQRKQLTLDIIKQYYLQTKNEADKYTVLKELQGFLTSGQMIIFTQTRETAIDLQKKMTLDGNKVGLLHGGKEMTSDERDKIMDAFRAGSVKVLITTNLLARGIDVLQVMMVVNFDIPVTGSGALDSDSYLHRIGRAGRFGKKGVAINLVHDTKSCKQIEELERHFNRKIEPLVPSQFPELGETVKAFFKENEEIIANYHKNEEENNTTEVKKLEDDKAT